MKKKITALAIMLAIFLTLCPMAFAETYDYDVGDTVYLGYYEIDGDSSNGLEEIPWTVLKRTRDNRVLLLCDYCLDTLPYDSSGDDVTWADSEIREWLNGEFIETAFYGDPDDYICTVEISTPAGQNKKTDGGDDTEDKVFLLSIDEVQEYLTTYDSRKTPVTDYAKKIGAKVDGHGNGRWWLRSPGGEQDKAANIHAAGGINYDGRPVESEEFCIRPALWLDLNVISDA